MVPDRGEFSRKTKGGLRCSDLGKLLLADSGLTLISKIRLPSGYSIGKLRVTIARDHLVLDLQLFSRTRVYAGGSHFRTIQLDADHRRESRSQQLTSA